MSLDTKTLEKIRDESFIKAKSFDCPYKSKPFFYLAIAIGDVLKQISIKYQSRVVFPKTFPSKSREDKTS